MQTKVIESAAKNEDQSINLHIHLIWWGKRTKSLPKYANFKDIESNVQGYIYFATNTFATYLCITDSL